MVHSEWKAECESLVVVYLFIGGQSKAEQNWLRTKGKQIKMPEDHGESAKNRECAGPKATRPGRVYNYHVETLTGSKQVRETKRTKAKAVQEKRRLEKIKVNKRKRYGRRSK